MLDKKVEQLLNEQINKEFYSAYLYLDFANFYQSKGLDGFANWYQIQAQEERDHAMLFYQYLHNNNCAVVLETIEKPDQVFQTLAEPLKAGLKRSMLPVLSTTSMQQLMMSRISARPSFWTGSSRNRVKKKPMRTIWSPALTCSATTQRACICWTMS